MIAPVSPLKLIVVLFPLQIGLAVALALPATVVGSTLTVAATEFAAGQLPLCTSPYTTLFRSRFPVGSGLTAEAISFQALPSVDDCHFMMAAVSPVKLIVVLVPLQIGLAVALALPATVVGSTLTVAATEFAAGQVPLCTTARN